MNEGMLVSPGLDAEAAAKVAADDARKREDEQKRLVKQWRARIEQGRKHDETARERYHRDRLAAAGSSKWLVDTNLIGAILEILMAFIFAKNPDVSVEPSDSVNDDRNKKYADMTRTLEIVISRLLKDAGLKRKAKRWVRSAMTIGVGWLKVAMQTRTENDPVIQGQINDLVQQLARVNALQAEIDEGCGDQEAQRAELEANMTALEAKLERQIAVGLALDFVMGDDIQVSPECGELENYLEAPWINVRSYHPKDFVRALTNWDDDTLKRANVYHQRPRKPDESSGDGSPRSPQLEWVKAGNAEAESIDGFLVIDEIQSKRDGVIYTLVDGIEDKFAREPYAPRQSSRFYDVFLLAFHYVDGERHPQSDVHQLARLQDEYGRTRSNFAEHRKRAIPSMIVNGRAIKQVDLDKINSAEAGEWTPIEYDGDDMRKEFAEKKYPQFDPRLYDTSAITTDMEKISGAQDAMQSSVQVEKTATEAEIQNNGFGARIGTRKDEIEDVLGAIAQHVAELAMQTLDMQYVTRVAGDHAVWPQLTVDEIMYGFDITVKAGSTGKPNTAAQRAAWQTILPMVEKIITVVGNFRAQGPQMEWAAKPYVELLHETSRRLGDKFDVDKLLPMPPVMAPAPPVIGADGTVQPPAPPMAPVLGAAGTPSAPPAPPSP